MRRGRGETESAIFFCENLFCEEKVFSLGERRPGLVALVGHEGRWVTLGGLVFICTRYPLVDAD